MVKKIKKNNNKIKERKKKYSLAVSTFTLGFKIHEVEAKILFFPFKCISTVFLIYFLLKDNCLTEFCCFLSNPNMN